MEPIAGPGAAARACNLAGRLIDVGSAAAGADLLCGRSADGLIKRNPAWGRRVLVLVLFALGDMHDFKGNDGDSKSVLKSMF